LAAATSEDTLEGMDVNVYGGKWTLIKVDK
jgi:hypothetical protein